eukprot:6715676-Ditylum_brightwellii.AAC.1
MMEGLDWYHEPLEREKLERKELKEKYKDNPQDQPDYLEFPRLQDKVKGPKKCDKTNEINDAQE